jgi:hypothetical protein
MVHTKTSSVRFDYVYTHTPAGINMCTERHRRRCVFGFHTLYYLIGLDDITRHYSASVVHARSIDLRFDRAHRRDRSRRRSSGPGGTPVVRTWACENLTAHSGRTFDYERNAYQPSVFTFRVQPKSKSTGTRLNNNTVARNAHGPG